MRNPFESGKVRAPFGCPLRARATVAIVSLLLLWLGVAPAATAQEHQQRGSHQPAPPAGAATERRPAAARPVAGREIVIRGEKIFIPDVSLVDQDGRKVRLYEDLIRDKTVAVGFFYTKCTYICTRHGELFSRLQEQLGPRLGKDVFLISISMDPTTDTPERMTEWGRSYGRRQGWTLLTGQFDEVGKALIAMTADSPGPREGHGMFFYIANDKTGTWEVSYLYNSLGEITKRLNELSSPGK